MLSAITLVLIVAVAVSATVAVDNGKTVLFLLLLVFLLCSFSFPTPCEVLRVNAPHGLAHVRCVCLFSVNTDELLTHASYLQYDPRFAENRIHKLCKHSAEVGPCREYRVRWCYNKKSQKCEEFLYGGCGGNTNNFQRSDLCKNLCETKLQPGTQLGYDS
ncbi:unnamed protein product [Soboliphyme baturini]|uniref:BPTI/Kunitz inhibitor domain-containing protein n=1 Tax=Soboliphyme baturini TaxID=241478 RepID=A0A183IIG2_9BILA|nr:unnamed protein product [Soboliphyme baturini]